MSVTPWATQTIMSAFSPTFGKSAKRRTPQTATKAEASVIALRWPISRARRGQSPAATSVGPRRRPNGSSFGSAFIVHTAPSSAPTAPSTTQRRRRRLTFASGRSRIAAMMFSRLIRMLVATTVTSAIRKPIANPSAMLGQRTVKTRSKRLCSVLNVRADAAMISRPSPMPASVPRSAAASAYSQPSVANAPTSQLRRMPTARAMPSSGLRSAANITNRFTSRSTPASTPKLPMPVKSCVNASPVVFAWSSTTRLIFRTSTGPTACAIWRETMSVRRTPLSTPPRLEIAIE